MNILPKDYFEKKNFFDFCSPYVIFDFTAYIVMIQRTKGFGQICATFMGFFYIEFAICNKFMVEHA